MDELEILHFNFASNEKFTNFSFEKLAQAFLKTQNLKELELNFHMNIMCEDKAFIDLISSV